MSRILTLDDYRTLLYETGSALEDIGYSVRTLSNPKYDKLLTPESLDIRIERLKTTIEALTFISAQLDN